MMRWLTDLSSEKRGSAGSLWLLLAGCLLVALLGLWLSRPDRSRRVVHDQATTGLNSTDLRPTTADNPSRFRANFRPSPALTPEEVVAQKVSQFAKSRLELARALARRHNVSFSTDAEAFFAAVASGNWEEIEKRFNAINGGDSSAGHAASRTPELTQIWPAIIDAYGAAEQAHLLPAQELLTYGQNILNALRPGMVYVGGTDAGRWVPELLNETSDGEKHIVITQNGLADATYLDYLRLQYDDQMASLTEEEAQRCFQEYTADTQKRLAHDQNFPNEPKQLRPGEEVRIQDGKTQVSGQVAVMSINEKLLQALLQKNPELSFGLQESFPLKNTYPGAVPLGPIMELAAAAGPSEFTSERANQTLDYWQNRADQLLASGETPASIESLKNYSHDIDAAANLLAAHGFSQEAEQSYRLSSRVLPSNPESVAALSQLLNRNGRTEESQQLLGDFIKRYPDNMKFLEQVGVDFRWTSQMP